MSRISLPLLLALLLASCANSGKPEPVRIVLDEDSCVECRMAVSQQPFAAEVVKRDRIADYFDDIGCLVYYARKGLPEGSAAYVVDFDTRDWVEAQAAFYVLSKDLPTPMSYGLGAFSTREAAETALNRWPGKVVGWEQLLEEFNP
jgi:copper chaperone NosL